MDRFRHLAVTGLLIAVTLAAAAPLGAQSVPAVALAPAEMETFLLKAKVAKKKTSKKGVTATIQATLADDRVTHDAQIQCVDESSTVFSAGRHTELNFKDTYRYNIGAYRLSLLLGMDNVPMSVKRRHEGKDCAFTWWVDDVQFDEEGRLKQKSIQGPAPERTSMQNAIRLSFDELIQNKDRNQGNLLWTNAWKLWLIDHTRAFRTGNDLLKPEQLTRIDANFLQRMRGLTLEAMSKSMGDIMTRDELSAVIARRDRLVKHFEDRIATRGEAAVLFRM